MLEAISQVVTGDAVTASVASIVGAVFIVEKWRKRAGSNGDGKSAAMVSQIDDIHKQAWQIAQQTETVQATLVTQGSLLRKQTDLIKDLCRDVDELTDNRRRRRAARDSDSDS